MQSDRFLRRILVALCAYLLVGCDLLTDRSDTITVHTRTHKKGATGEERSRAENTGVLISSGFIAGESLMAVLLALLVIGGDFIPGLLGFQALSSGFEPNFLLSLIAYPLVIYMLVWVPMKRMKEGGLPSAKID